MVCFTQDDYTASSVCQASRKQGWLHQFYRQIYVDKYKVAAHKIWQTGTILDLNTYVFRLA